MTDVTTHDRPTAILVGSEPRIVVTAARSLARLGVRVTVAVPPGQHFTIESRAIDAVIPLEGERRHAASSLVQLTELERASWIAACSDVGLAIICDAYDRLAGITALACPAPAVVQQILDKQATLEVAERVGVPVPQSFTIETREDVEAMATTLGFPLIAKPANKSATQARHNFKTRTLRDLDELRAAFNADPEFGRGLVFQRMAHGDGVGIEIVMHDSEPIATFQHRRLDELPPEGGVAVTAVSEPVDPRLLEHSVRLLKALGWSGPAMVEFKHDRRTGETALMEVNGRFWGSLPLAVKAGVDFPAIAWQAATGAEITAPTTYAHGVRFRWTAGALQRLALGAGSGRAIARLGWDFVTQFAPGTRSAMWSSSDPGPAIQEPVQLMRTWLKQGIKSAAARVLPAHAYTTMKLARDMPADRRGRYVRHRFATGLAGGRRQQLPREIGTVLFVCHGNIIRSAAAAALLQDELSQSGIDTITVESGGTRTRVGRPADPRADAAVRRFGVSLEQHRSQPLTRELVGRADVIFVMDDMNLVDVLTEFPEARSKTLLLGGLDTIGAHRRYHGVAIEDPYTGAPAAVASTIDRVRACVVTLAGVLAREQNVHVLR